VPTIGGRNSPIARNIEPIANNAMHWQSPCRSRANLNRRISEKKGVKKNEEKIKKG